MSIIKAHKLLILGLASFASPALALEGVASASYASAFVSDDPVMSFGVKAQETLPYDLQLSLEQSINRNLVVDDSKKEWEWNDTVMALGHAYKSSETLTLGARLSATLPTSRESRHNELRTRPELRVSGTVLLPYDITSATSASYARYWHKFDATRPEGQTSGGDALPVDTYAFAQSLTMVFLEKFDAGLNASYRVKRYHDLKTTEGYIAARNRLESYAYAVGVLGSYNHTDKTSLSVSYDQGSGLERPGYNDFVIFDKEQSTWTVSVAQLW